MEVRGLDLPKRESQQSIKADDGTVTDRRIATSRERFTAVFGARPRARILLEASTESEWVARHLESLGHEVIVADPNSAPMYANRSRRTKTDKREARPLLRQAAPPRVGAGRGPALHRGKLDRGGSTIHRADDAITDCARTDWRAAAGPLTRSCAPRAAGPAVTVGGAPPAGPIRRAGGTAAHADGPRVVVASGPSAGDWWSVGGRAWGTCQAPARSGPRRWGAPWPGVRCSGGAGTEVREGLVDHRRLPDERDDPHHALAGGTP
jgi:hypothetical protein